MQDLSSDQVRKIGHEQQVIDKTVFRHLADIGIHQKCDLGEGEEGDSDWQDDAE